MNKLSIFYKKIYKFLNETKLRDWSQLLYFQFKSLNVILYRVEITFKNKMKKNTFKALNLLLLSKNQYQKNENT